MAQLSLRTKIRTKQWLVLGASAFQCTRAGFLCPKCDSFVCLHIRQKIKMSFSWKYDFFSKFGIFCNAIAKPLSEAYTSVYTTIFVWRKDKTNYLSNQTWVMCYHSRNKHQLDGGPYITEYLHICKLIDSVHFWIQYNTLVC